MMEAYLTIILLSLFLYANKSNLPLARWKMSITTFFSAFLPSKEQANEISRQMF